MTWQCVSCGRRDDEPPLDDRGQRRVCADERCRGPMRPVELEDFVETEPPQGAA